MLENVISAAVTALTDAGLSAGPAFPKGEVDRETAFVRVGVAGAIDRSAGFDRYLGMKNDAETGEREVYGLRCELTLSLDVYAPLSETNAALACAVLFDKAAAAISGVPGLRVRELRCGVPQPELETGMFRLSGDVRCAGLLTIADSGGQDALFTDFILRGELQA